MPIGFRYREGCPACAAASPRELLRLPFDEPGLWRFIDRFYQQRVPRQALSGGSYGLMNCDACGLVYQDPVLDDTGMATLYGDWVDQARSLEKKRRAGAELYRQYAGQVSTLLRISTRRPAETRVLDYGMGWGYWARMALAHGFDVSGFELSPQRQAQARAFGIRVIERLDPASPAYDFIFANQVFEHLRAPRETLEALLACLAPAGVVQIRVPDGRGMAARLARRGWSSELDAVHPLEHINCFDRRALLLMARKCGLEVFNPPPRLTWGSLRGGLKREFSDRFRAPHLYLRRR